MQTYSISYLDKGGRTELSEFLTFDDNPAAVAHARIGLLKNHIVEIWTGDNLVTRLYREEPAAVGTRAPVLVQEVESYLSPAVAVTDWESEGGAARQLPIAAPTHRIST
jgi:hypothetical protein